MLACECKGMTEKEKIEVRKLFLEELKIILHSSVKQIDARVIPVNADIASRRAIAYLVEAVDYRLDDLYEIDENK